MNEVEEERVGTLPHVLASLSNNKKTIIRECFISLEPFYV